MKMQASLIAVALLAVPAFLQADDRTAEAYSRVFIHNDGTHTKSWKYAGKKEICEETYSEEGIRTRFTVFLLDDRGRIQKGAIYDGSKRSKLGMIEYGYDKKTDRLVQQRTYDARGRHVEDVWMPEAFDPVKYPEFAQRGVRLRYDPNNPNAKPKADTRDVKPALPARETDGQKFEPGMAAAGAAPGINDVDEKSPEIEVKELPPSAIPESTPAVPAPAQTGPAPKSFFKKKTPSATPPAAPAPTPAPKPTVPPAAAPQPTVPAPPAAVPAAPAPRT